MHKFKLIFSFTQNDSCIIKKGKKGLKKYTRIIFRKIKFSSSSYYFFLKAGFTIFMHIMSTINLLLK